MKLGIVSDIHCQHHALEQALDAIGPVDRLVCAGDAIDQTRFCNQTVAILRDRDIQTIQGNHEAQFFAGHERHSASVHPDLAQWLATRPREMELSLAGRRVQLVHATNWSTDFPYVPQSHRDFRRFAKAGTDVVIYGHTHTPVVQLMQGTLIVNPGSVGEGRPGPGGFVRSCAIMDLVTGEVRIIDLD